MTTKTLDMVLTHRWFDEILKGRKTAEYRKVTPYWTNRLTNIKQGDVVVFRRGYTGQTLARRITGVRVITGFNLPQEEYEYFGKVNEQLFFEISFG